MNGTDSIPRSQITGLVLAGGRGSRMGGLDKGLLLHRGQPLALHAAQRLAPQVGALLINANRNPQAYAAFGWPVVADDGDAAGAGLGTALGVRPGVAHGVAPGVAPGVAHYPGPLAGMLAGLRHSRTPYLATVACDTPDFPADLVQRLVAALQASGAVMAMAMTPGPAGAAAAQPVFCLLHISLHDSLAAALQAGQHTVRAWAAAQGCVPVLFDNAAAFANANTPQELQALQPAGPETPSRHQPD